MRSGRLAAAANGIGAIALGLVNTQVHVVDLEVAVAVGTAVRPLLVGPDALDNDDVKFVVGYSMDIEL